MTLCTCTDERSVPMLQDWFILFNYKESNVIYLAFEVASSEAPCLCRILTLSKQPFSQLKCKAVMPF